MAQAGSFADNFGSSFVDGFLGMLKIDAERQRTEGDLMLRQQAEDRARALQEFSLKQKQAEFGISQGLPGDIGSIYRAAAPVDAPTQQLGPVAAEPALAITDVAPVGSYGGGRPAASTYGDLVQRGVDPTVIGRVQQYAPKTLDPLGLMNPEAAKEFQRRDQARTEVVGLLNEPLSADPMEQSRHFGKVVGALYKGGFIQGPDVVKGVQAEMERDPQTAVNFFTAFQKHLGEQNAANPPAQGRQGLDTTANNIRQALAGALGDVPSIMSTHPKIVEAFDLKGLTKGSTGAAPRPGVPLPANSPGIYVEGQGGQPGTIIPTPGGATPAGRPVAVGAGGLAVPDTSQASGYRVLPPAAKPEGPPKDPIDTAALDTATKLFPDGSGDPARLASARQFYRERMHVLRSHAPAFMERPQDAEANYSAIVDAATRIAYPDRPSAVPPEAKSQSWSEMLYSFIHGDGGTAGMGAGAPGGPGQDPNAYMGAGAPRGRPVAPPTAPAGPPPGALPSPQLGPVAPEPSVGPSGVTGVAPGTPGPTRPTPGGQVYVNPAPPNATPEQFRAEVQRLTRLGVPPAQIQALMRPKGW